VFVAGIERCHIAGVKVKMVLETSKVSPDLCLAAVEAAYTHECNLIVLARGENTLVGSHAHTIKEISLVPVLIVANRYGHKIKPPQPSETTEEASGRPFELLNNPSPAATHGTGWSSYAIMAVSFVKCLLQMAAFIWAWLHTQVDLFLVQALHMGSDLVQNIFNVWVTHESRKPSTREFPFGKKNGPVIANFFTGLVLWIFAGKLVYDSAHAVISPTHQQPHYPWILWAITGWFALNSLVIGPLQIRIGKSNHDPAVEGDGHETVGDALIDVVAFFGTLAMATYQAAWIEHVLSILVAIFIIRTGYELVSEGWKTLNQHTIGLNHEEAILCICQKMAGIVNTTISETFAVGTIAVCNIQLKTMATKGETDLVCEVLETKIIRYLQEAGFASWRLNFQTKRESQGEGRIVVAVQKDSFGYAIAPFDTATAFLICDRVRNGKDKVRVEPVDGDSFQERVALLQRKHAREVYAWTYERGADLARQGIDHNLAICRNPVYLVPALLTEQ
jgi:cation diffusion facilitator family transporter